MTLRRNTYWNLIGGVLPLIAAAVFIPYTLKSLGNEMFGMLTLIWALIGYFSFFDMGVGRAITYQLSKYRAEDNKLQIQVTLKSGIVLIFLAGIVGASVMFLLAPFLATKLLKVNHASQGDVLIAFEIAALGVIPTTLTGLLRGALEGLGDFASSNINKIVLGSSMFILPALSISLNGNSLSTITSFLVVARVFASILAFLPLRNYLIQPNSFGEKLQFNRLLNYGMWVTITAIVGPLMVYGDRFFVGAMVGAEYLPFYSIPQEGLQRLLIIPTALSGALLPYLTTLKREELVYSYHQNFKKTSVFMFVLCFIVICLSYPFFAYWISPAFASSSFYVVTILTVGIWFNSIALIPYTLIHAKGNPKITAFCHLGELFFYIFILWILTDKLGILGAAIAWTLRVFLDFILLHSIARLILKNEQY